MTAVTVNETFDNTLASEGALRIVEFTGRDYLTYTPTVSSGKSIKILGGRSASGTAIEASVDSNNVITIQLGLATVADERGTLLYTEV